MKWIGRGDGDLVSSDGRFRIAVANFGARAFDSTGAESPLMPSIEAAVNWCSHHKGEIMTKPELMKLLEDVEDSAQLWVQTYNQTATGKMSPVVFAEILGDEIKQEGANEGDLVFRIG